MFKGVSRYNKGMDSIANISDTLIEVSGLFKIFPVFSTAVSVYNASKNFIDKHNLNKLKSFLISLNDEMINDDELKAYIQSLVVDKEMLNQETEYLLVLLERQLEYDKSSILAKFYIEYLKKGISWDDFVEYSAILERLILSDVSTLWLCNNTDGIRYEDTEDVASVFRLLALGLVYMPAKDTWNEVGRGDGYMDFKPTIAGRKFSKILNL